MNKNANRLSLVIQFQTIILFLAFAGSALSALVPVGNTFYSNFISQRPSEFPNQRLQVGTNLDAYFPQQYVTYDVPQVNTAVRTVPTAVFANGRPTIAHIPTYNYYGTPVYDFRFPFNGISPPGSIPSSPGYVPKPEVPKPPNNSGDDDDGIEKLDEKVDPGYDPLGEKAGAANSGEISDEDDSIVVDTA